MKEIISEYGNAILAAFIVITIIGLCYGIFQGQLRDAIIKYDESLYGAIDIIRVGGMA